MALALTLNLASCHMLLKICDHVFYHHPPFSFAVLGVEPWPHEC